MGKSLNDMFYKSPDLSNSLVRILLRFRADRVAVMADIESMFYQVIVWDCDVSFLRFLWWEDDDWAHEMWELQIGVYHFRAVSSPTCTNSALWKTAEDNQRSFPPSVINTVKNYFYVDDCLKSLPSDAIQHAYSLRVLLSRGFLKITTWISNSRNFLETIPELERSKDINNIDARKYEWPVQRGFRVQWSPYKVCILSAASSTSDPSGFLAFFVLTAKEILQDLCRMKLGWDDEIPDEYRSRWESWLANLSELSNFTVSRCLKPVHFG